MPDQTEIIITATKREENLQNVPQSVQVIGTRKLDQLNISNFEQYTKQLPSVSYNVSQSGGTVVYMRGVASGGDGNHSGSLPSVGVYLDEQPVTTIGGALDVHIYDIARIESLAGPQGTLYGASSEAGTIRIITNKPDLNATYGRVDGELNTVAHGGPGGKLEGMINIPLANPSRSAAVGFYQRDAGLHRQCSRYADLLRRRCPDPDTGEIIGCVHNGFTVNNAAFVKNNYQHGRTYGGRAALKIDLDDNWTVTPTVMHQYDEVMVSPASILRSATSSQRFRGNEYRKDKFTQAALTDRRQNLELRPDLCRRLHGPADLFDRRLHGLYRRLRRHYECSAASPTISIILDSAGNPIDPQQYIVGTEHFRKISQEVRIATPKEYRARALSVPSTSARPTTFTRIIWSTISARNLSVNGWPGTIWLTLQDRIDKD